eukprot:4062644-Prymnesium_polylepis.1
MALHSPARSPSTCATSSSSERQPAAHDSRRHARSSARCRNSVCIICCSRQPSAAACVDALPASAT